MKNIRIIPNFESIKYERKTYYINKQGNNKYENFLDISQYILKSKIIKRNIERKFKIEKLNNICNEI